MVGNEKTSGTMSAIPYHPLPAYAISCVVCGQDFKAADQVTQHPCGHLFHTHCLTDPWDDKSGTECKQCGATINPKIAPREFIFATPSAPARPAALTSVSAQGAPVYNMADAEDAKASQSACAADTQHVLMVKPSRPQPAPAFAYEDEWWNWKGDNPPLAAGAPSGPQNLHELLQHHHAPTPSYRNFPPPNDPTAHYPVDTTLADGRQCLLLDIGSVGNLAGDQWVKSVALEAMRNGGNPSYVPRERALNVSGVGRGTQVAQMDCHLPIALRSTEDEVGQAYVHHGSITIPALQDSATPGLLGLVSMRHNRTLLDTINNKVHFLGPGDLDIEKHLPAGSKTFQCEYSQSGHMVLPCCEFTGRIDAETKLSLYASEPVPSAAPTSGGSNSADAGRGRTLQRSSSADQVGHKRSSSKASNTSTTSAPPALALHAQMEKSGAQN